MGLVFPIRVSHGRKQRYGTPKFVSIFRLRVPYSYRGRGSLVVKVTDSWSTCHEFEPNTAEDPPCRGAMHVKSVESSNVLPFVWCGVVVRRGACQLRCRPRHLTMVQNYEVHPQKPSSSSTVRR
ncbi:uncharacterized protein TNCV_4415171 [Trichonephila clavipes]|uniref:Uncharacterized protein n=1 Tax=Trichonephila clavipes TaxID=2585209 RepID=A0A8X6V9K3_TRICX|nr:uncharacterized protein TNCV_4415171 [Trichonephila clavipes]